MGNNYFLGGVISKAFFDRYLQENQIGMFRSGTVKYLYKDTGGSIG